MSPGVTVSPFARTGLGRLLDAVTDGMLVIDQRGAITLTNSEAERLFGYGPGDLVGGAVEDLVPARFRGNHLAHRAAYSEDPRPRPMGGGLELCGLRKDGSEFPAEISLSPFELDGVPVTIAAVRDVSERRALSGRLQQQHAALDVQFQVFKEGEAALRESEERFRQIAECSSEVFFLVDLTTFQSLYVSPRWSDIWGRPPADAADPRIWFEAIHPDDQLAVRRGQEAVLRGEANTVVFRVRRPDGTVRWVRGRTFPVRNSAGVVYRMVGASEDITELKRTEEQFAQAQRMEAVGRLAGGVAHDFNNLLTVILGEVDLMGELPLGDAGARPLEQIRKAGERAVSLTRQLLAFSRRQLIQPTVFKLNEAVADMERMLRRLIGEDIEVVTRMAGDAGAVRADRGQVEQVLTNLSVNARDAMPGGGTLTLETRNVTLDDNYARGHAEVTPGEYVMLGVSDTGTGMSEAVKAQVFEPFFTTKEPGKGTGLGLATCYGIVKQAGGHIAVYSELGVGTTMKVYLPLVQSAATGARLEPAALPRGHETILLVEDETDVRDVAARVLAGQGYRVLEARDGMEALRLLESHVGEVHLLLTDVVMPRMGGREVAEKARARKPGLKVLFTSGYTDDVILQHRLLEHEVALLQKPFTRATLARKVRDVLDR